jgi:hypothetical protein
VLSSPMATEGECVNVWLCHSGGFGPFCERRGGVMTLARRSSRLALQWTMLQHVHIHLPSAAAPRCVAESSRGPRRPTCSVCSCLAARQQAAQPLRLRLTVPASTFRPRRSGTIEWRRSGTGSSVYGCCLSAVVLDLHLGVRFLPLRRAAHRWRTCDVCCPPAKKYCG